MSRAFRFRPPPLLLVALFLTGLGGMQNTAATPGEKVKPIVAPFAPLPSEDQSKDVSKFSFVLYGDTRGGQDGVALQSDHSRVIEGILGQIKSLQGTDSPARFILQTGDAVAHGADPHEWNVSFVPLIDRLVQEGGIPYFFVPGNHDVSTATRVDAPSRQAGLRNVLDAVQLLIPPEGSPSRLAGYSTYSFGYGNTFVIGFDSLVANDDKQYVWIKGQLEKLDRKRYVSILVFCHHSPFSSGPHSLHLDEPTRVLRSRYLPLFQAHHVRAMLTGHEHLYEHWVEHYTDNTGLHRMDFIVSGGGGAPIYDYMREPNLDDYLKANEGAKVQLQHLVKPGRAGASSPHHFVVFRVDGEDIGLEFHCVDVGSTFHPYPGDHVELQDPGR